MKDDFSPLIELLKQYDVEYNEGRPSITDTEYDKFKESVYLKYPEHLYFKTVGVPTFEGKKVPLPFVLGSLDKVKADKIENWIDEDVIVSQKLDGVSVMVTFDKGKVVFAATRGNGQEGQDITEKAKYFIPSITDRDKISLRGEMLLTGDDDKLLGFKNRRNGVAGLISREDVSVDALMHIVVKFYEILDTDCLDRLETEYQRMTYIESLGLDVPKWSGFYKNDANILDCLNQMIVDNKSEIYDCDGLVIAKDISTRQNVMYPTNKIAYKVNTDAVKFIVDGVEWNLGRTGRVTPTILLQPQDLGGVTVSRATGFNYEFIMTNSIGKGAVVGIVRSGDVIPYITEVFEKAKVILISSECPKCHEDLEIKGVDLVCVNPECLSSNVKRIAHFFKTMGCEYITETTIRNLGVTTIEEMYDLDEIDISEIEGFGIKKGEQIVDEVGKTLYITPDKLLAAFGISGIGRTLSKPILEKYSFDSLFNVTDITDVEGVGEILSMNLVDNINSFRPLYEFLLDKGLSFIKKEKSMSNVAGKKFVMTGKAPVGRNEITEMITEKGGIVKNSVTKDTDYLVTEDTTSGSIKNTKAQKLGVTLINFADLCELLED